MEMMADVFSIITRACQAVFLWLTNLMNSVFGSYMVFGFIIVGTIVFTWALKALGLSGGSFTDMARRNSRIEASHRREYLKSVTPHSTYIDASHGSYKVVGD